MLPPLPITQLDRGPANDYECWKCGAIFNANGRDPRDRFSALETMLPFAGAIAAGAVAVIAFGSTWEMAVVIALIAFFLVALLVFGVWVPLMIKYHLLLQRPRESLVRLPGNPEETPEGGLRAWNEITLTFEGCVFIMKTWNSMNV